MYIILIFACLAKKLFVCYENQVFITIFKTHVSRFCPKLDEFNPLPSQIVSLRSISINRQFHVWFLFLPLSSISQDTFKWEQFGSFW